MKLIKNSGGDRVVDELRQCLAPNGTLDLATPAFSLFAFADDVVKTNIAAILQQHGLEDVRSL